jgi:hypothetical protein
MSPALIHAHLEESGQVFKVKRLELTTRPNVRIYADNFMFGRTPATVSAEVSVVKVLLPR